MSDPTFDKVRRETAEAAEAMRAALRPDAKWTCYACDHPIDRASEPFGADHLRDQVRHLPFSGNIINFALDQLVREGVLTLDSRFRLTVAPEKL